MTTKITTTKTGRLLETIRMSLENIPTELFTHQERKVINYLAFILKTPFTIASTKSLKLQIDAMMAITDPGPINHLLLGIHGYLIVWTSPAYIKHIAFEHGENHYNLFLEDCNNRRKAA